MAEKARLRRKDIKRPDEFITLTARGVAWARQHQTTVVWVAAGIIGLLLVVGISVAYQGARLRDANADLARALVKFEANDFPAASTELIDVFARWSGTRVAPIAGLIGANAAIDAGDPDRAITELGKVQAQASSLPGYVQQQILLAWGVALETKGEWLEAAEKYKQAAAMAGPYAGDALLGEARVRELGGENARARELYRQAYEQFPDLPQREFIASKK